MNLTNKRHQHIPDAGNEKQALPYRACILSLLGPIAVIIGLALCWSAPAPALAWQHAYRHPGYGYRNYYQYPPVKKRPVVKKSSYKKRTYKKSSHKKRTYKKTAYKKKTYKKKTFKKRSYKRRSYKKKSHNRKSYKKSSYKKSSSRKLRKSRLRKGIVKRSHAKKRKAKAHTRRGIRAKAVYCVNLTSNRTIVAKNADRRLPVASLTKLITALVVLDRMPLHRKVKVPKTVKRVPRSVVGLQPGDRVSVRDLLHGMLMQSGNDCAEVLARAYPGGRSKFMRALNRKARKLGTRRTRFYTPSGLDMKLVRKRKGKKTVRRIVSNVSTAREIAGIAKVAFANRVIRAISLKRTYVMASEKRKNGYRVRNTNKLLRANLPILGGKTGYTVRAGRCLATEFNPGRNRFVIVVLGSTNHFRDTRLVYRKALREVSRHGRKRAGARTRHTHRIATRFLRSGS